jgi:hypothetical protein
LALLVAVLTIAYLVGIAFDLSPWLRGPAEWRWRHVIPTSFQRLWLPAALLAGYLLFVIWLQPKLPKRSRTVLTLLVASFMTVAIQLALLYQIDKSVTAQLFLRTVSERSGGFFNVGAYVTEIGGFLDTFAEQMPGYPVHPQRHPPGLPVLFALARRYFEQQPQLAAQISSVVRPYQCHDLALMNLPNSAIASATIQMLLPLWLALIVWPLYAFGRLIYDEKTALRAALLWPVVPSVALWATRWNHLYALFTLLAFLLLHIGLARRKLLAFPFCGLVLSLAIFLTFGNITLVGFLGVYALIWLAVHQERPSFSWLIMGAGLLAISAIIPWVILWLVFDFDPIETWQTSLTTHLGIGRSYVTWLFYHLYDFFVFLGIPLFVAWAAGAIKAFREWRRGPADVLAISSAIALLLLNISGTSQGEVARVWAFLMPLFLLVAVRYLSSKSFALFAFIVSFLVLQVFVSDIYLRPVGTGLRRPPAPPPAVTLENDASLGIWQEGPILQAADFPRTASSGQAIPIQLVWSTSQQIHRPYTIFVHLVNDESKLIAQQDGLPLDGEWLTTCWQPEENFSETYEITTPIEAKSGTYQVMVGFYWFPTGERLMLAQPASQVSDSLILGQIELNDG